MVNVLSPVYVDLINSFREQCNELISKFKQKHYELFSDFAQLFKSYKFSLIYEKHVDSFFYFDFKEDSLQIAKDIMLNDHFLGGLYLLYGLYYVQDHPKHSIRLDYNEFEKVMELIKEERHTLLGTCQPGFVFAKLLRNDAFAYPYFSRDYSMEANTRTRIINSNTVVVREGVPINKKVWLEEFLEGNDIIDDLKRIDEEYFKKKHKLKEEHSDLNLALDLLPEDTLGGLFKTLLEGEKQETQPDKDVGASRREIKDTAMKRKGKKGSSSVKNKKISSQKLKRKGRPRGARKSYFNLVINKVDQSSESSSDSYLDDTILDMPEIN